MEMLRANSLAWLERTNPVRGLSVSRAGAIYDAARAWGSPRLQYVYNEIEQSDPVVMTCVERRASALAGLKQTFVALAGADRVLAEEQRDALTRFAAQIENFDEALERMDEAFFRGYVHLQPIWEGMRVRRIQPLNSWNFLRGDADEWLWNPDCRETPAGLGDVRDARLVSLVRRRAIDWPALVIYLRKALGERDYGRFIERHGIPHAALVMAPGTQEKDVPKYVAAANAWSNGQDISLPNGASIELATEARAADPFTPFVEHQDRYIVLLATGGTLTSLAQADTGALAGGAQMEVWREIVARDGVLVAGALNRDLFARYLAHKFPGRPIAAEFRLTNEKDPTASEVADLAGKLKAAGYTIDRRELEEAVGFKLVKDEEPAATLGGFAINKDLPAPAGQQPEGAGQRSPGTGLGGSSGDVLKAFAQDTGPAADAIRDFLDDPSQEAAEDLLRRLPGLIEDRALAAVIAEEMARAMAERLEKTAREPQGLTQEDAERIFEEMMGT